MLVELGLLVYLLANHVSEFRVQRRRGGFKGDNLSFTVTKMAKGAVMSLGPFSNSRLFTGMQLPRHYKRGFHTFVHETPVSSTM